LITHQVREKKEERERTLQKGLLTEKKHRNGVWLKIGEGGAENREARDHSLKTTEKSTGPKSIQYNIYN
jgi:hypothetical protein